jgi:CHAT domain-containing protein
MALSALLIGQPDAPDLPPLPKTVDEIKTVESIILLEAPGANNGVQRETTTLIGEDATIDGTLKALPNVSTVHFACHGFQDREDPFRR